MPSGYRRGARVRAALTLATLTPEGARSASERVSTGDDDDDDDDDDGGGAQLVLRYERCRASHVETTPAHKTLDQLQDRRAEYQRCVTNIQCSVSAFPLSMHARHERRRVALPKNE